MEQINYNCSTNSKGGKLGKKVISKALDDLEDEGLALLIPDIQSTAELVNVRIDFYGWLYAFH